MDDYKGLNKNKGSRGTAPAGKPAGGKAGKWLLVLHIALLIYSCTSLCSKNAVRYPAFSLPYLGFYAVMIGILGVYAIIWQQVIKHLPVTFAYANKAVTVVWGVVLGRLFFGESVTAVQLAGCGVIIAGTVLYVTWAKEDKDE